MGSAYEWKGYGVKLHVPPDSLPANCSQHSISVVVRASLSGQYKFPDGCELVSGIYWIYCPVKLSKPLKLELQHCSDEREKLSFVRTNCTQEQLPYLFTRWNGGVFSEHSSHGSISLSRFSGWGIVQCLMSLFVSQSENQQAETEVSDDQQQPESQQPENQQPGDQEPEVQQYNGHQPVSQLTEGHQPRSEHPESQPFDDHLSNGHESECLEQHHHHVEGQKPRSQQADSQQHEDKMAGDQMDPKTKNPQAESSQHKDQRLESQQTPTHAPEIPQTEKQGQQAEGKPSKRSAIFPYSAQVYYAKATCNKWPILFAIRRRRGLDLEDTVGIYRSNSDYLCTACYYNDSVPRCHVVHQFKVWW